MGNWFALSVECRLIWEDAAYENPSQRLCHVESMRTRALHCQ